MDVKELKKVKDKLKDFSNEYDCNMSFTYNDYIELKNNEYEEIENYHKIVDLIFNVKVNLFIDYLLEFIKQYENEILKSDFEKFYAFMESVINEFEYNYEWDYWKNSNDIKNDAENYIKEFLEGEDLKMKEIIKNLINIAKTTQDHNTKWLLLKELQKLIYEFAITYNCPCNWRDIGEELEKEYFENDEEIYEALQLYDHYFEIEE